ncbi:MAG TPA: UDP-N-acetylmuramate--L-alanine ligase [Candidatus Angelobacter sp.]|jgi:UDP-N-acetylmuramate--alanine ligase
MFAKIQRIHFVGIGGIGMSGIAEVLLTLGYKVSGSDLRNSAVTERLAERGAIIFEGHRAENITGAEVVVASSAVKRDNPEIAAAHAEHVPVIQRAEMLAELMRLKYGIAIAGMHGKTTTTSMVAAVLAGGGLDPTVVVGGRVDAMGSNARLGKSQYMVAEADESDRSFLKLSPILAVVTNIDREHMDCYSDMADVEQAFLGFIDRVPFYGMAVLCHDDERLRNMLPRLARRATTYGTHEDSDFRVSAGKTKCASNKHYAHFSIDYRGKSLGDFHLRVPGNHNILNAAAAVAVGVGLDIEPDRIREALENFRGVDRRFQLKGRVADVSVIDDYGHHPTEVRATLAAARQCGFKRIHVIFQPHRFTRTRDMLEEFGASFNDADTLSVLDIYAASEPPITGITAERLVETIKSSGSQSQGDKRVTVNYARSFEEAAQQASAAAEPGDMVLTLGAGSVSQLGQMVLEQLKKDQLKKDQLKKKEASLKEAAS